MRRLTSYIIIWNSQVTSQRAIAIATRKNCCRLSHHNLKFSVPLAGSLHWGREALALGFPCSKTCFSALSFSQQKRGCQCWCSNKNCRAASILGEGGQKICKHLELLGGVKPPKTLGSAVHVKVRNF